MRYTNKFKLKAIKLKDKGINPNKIFEDEGFNIKDKNKDYARKLINEWKRKFKEKESNEMKKKIKYLEAQVRYLEEEKRFFLDLPKKK